jgi:hypothetical protein
MGLNAKSPLKASINTSPLHGWRAPTVALKTTEKHIYMSAPPVHYNPPTVNVTFNSGEFSGEEY